MTEFTKRTKSRDGFNPDCRPCRAFTKKLGRYSITAERWAQMLGEQGGRCAICGSRPDDGRVLAVDHNHACCPGETSCGACVRGLLCGRCNMAIGLFQDSPDRLRAAAHYITSF